MGFLEGVMQSAAPVAGTPSLEQNFDATFGSPLMPNNPVPALDVSGGPIDVSNILQTANLPQQTPDIPTGKRRSVLDTIGGIADVLARVGGADPLYQAGLDARHEREMAGQIEPLKLENLRQQLAANQQKFDAGNIELANARASQLGQAARGLAAVFQKGGAPAVQQAWPVLAKQLGISPEQQALFSEQLAADPEGTITGLTAALTDPKAAGTAPREMQIYQLLAQKNPALAQQYLARVASGVTEMSPYQQAQLDLALSKFGYQRGKDERDFDFEREKFYNPQPKDGGSTLTNTQRGVIASNMALLPNIQKQLQTVRDLAEQMDREGTLATGAIGGMVPGGLAGDTAAKFDRAIANLQSQFRKISRTPGEGSTSDFETRLQQATMPSRTTNSAGRKQAIDDLATQIAGLQEAYQGLLNPATSPAPSGGGRAPLPGTPPPRNRGRSQPRTVTVSNW